MTPISARTPRVTPSPVFTGAGAAPLAATPASRSLASQVSTFEPAAPRAAIANTAGAWRGAPDSEVGRAVATMLQRAQQSNLTLGSDSVVNMLSKAILDNRSISNEQLLAMSRVPLEKLADSPEDRAATLKAIPDARERDSHKFTVALLSAVTGVDPQQLSQVAPGLGMTGSPNSPVLFAPESDRVKRSTALHDFTDYMRAAGVAGINKAVWGTEDRVLSALKSYLFGVPY